MQFCVYCNCYFLEKPLNHLSSKIQKENVLKSTPTKSTFRKYKNYMEKRSISTEDLNAIVTIGRLELSVSDFKELENSLYQSPAARTAELVDADIVLLHLNSPMNTDKLYQMLTDKLFERV